MNKTEAKKRIEELRKQAEYHAKKYYDEEILKQEDERI